MLDASKACNMVNHCELFSELLKRDISPILLSLLLDMYTSQTLRVSWGHAVSNCLLLETELNREAYYPATFQSFEWRHCTVHTCFV